MDSERLIFWFEELGLKDNNIVGKKCANLGEMIRMGLPVPPGFAISIAAYQKFARESGVASEISSFLSHLGPLKGQNIALFDHLSQELRRIIEKKEIPDEIKEAITSYYHELGKRVKTPNLAVSVRSSGVESRPGMFETYLNVIGVEDLLAKVKLVWSSAYTARAIAFRINKDLPIIGDELGVAISQMVDARSAGIALTLEPVSNDTSKIVIEANWGLGEGVVSGVEAVDRFVIDKKSFTILDRNIGRKTRRVTKKERGVGWEEVAPENQLAPCLSSDEVISIAKLAIILEERLGRPQDIEWVIDARSSPPNNIFILQTRPALVPTKTEESVTDRMIDLIVKRFYRPNQLEEKGEGKG